MKTTIASAFLLLFLTLSAAEAVDLPWDLPVTVPDSLWLPLREHVDGDLQKGLEGRLSKVPKWSSLIAKQKMAVGLVDLTRPEAARFASANGNTMIYAASLPKIAILLAAHKAIEDGTLKETPEVRADLERMIRRSSNPAATRTIDRLGGVTRVDSVLTDPDYAFYDPRTGGGLWVGKRYAKLGERFGDPLKGLSHGATVTQVCRFYYRLATGRLINAKRSREMLVILSDPCIHHKFVHSLEQIAPQARLYRKSGTWKWWHSDSVLVWGPEWRRYILVALVEDPLGEIILKDLVASAEEVLRGL